MGETLNWSNVLRDPNDAADEIERLRAALKDIQAKAVSFRPPRFTWFYDRAEEALTGVKDAELDTDEKEDAENG
jgi:hypothetical protein